MTRGGAAGRHGRVVLDVGLRQVLLREFHVPAFEHFTPEVVDQTLVRGKLRIDAGEHLLVIRVRRNGDLPLSGARSNQRGGEE